MPNEAPPLRFDDPAIVQANPEAIVVAVARLARQVADLHRQDFWSGKIGQETVEIRHSTGELQLELRRDTSKRLVVGRAPPEATGASGKEFSPLRSIAHVELQKLGQACTPERIDSYQIACLAIELLTQANVQQYLSDLAIAARMPRSLRNVLDLALGWGGAVGPSTPLALAASLEDWLQEPKPPIDGNTPSNYIPPSPTKRFEIKGTSAATQPKVPLPFEQLGPYRIIDRIGSGGMGDVFRGREEGLNRDVAIKVLPRQLASQDDFVSRFHTEAAAIAKAAHPNIVPIYSIGFDQGCHYFAMQYVEDDTLGTLLAREKRLSPLRAADLTLQILSGLGWVHRQGLVHRDLKPSNILLDHTTQRAMVADFGLVKSVEESNALTVSGVVMGTVDYISPEQARGGAIDARADLYSVGVLLYQMLAGRLPFEGDSATSMLFQHIYEPPPRLETIAPEAPKAIADIVHHLMEKKPADRLTNCEETTRALREAIDQMVSGLSADRSGKRHTTICKAPRWADEPIAGAPAVDLSRSEASPNETSTTSPQNLGWRWFRGRVAKVAGLKAQTVDQTTCLQVDEAILEYQRRKISLQRLLSEAKSIERQLKEHPPDSEATAIEVQDHAALLKEQQEQIETMELAFAKASANLTKLTAQRDALRARLRMAEASIEAVSMPHTSSANHYLRLAAIGAVSACILGFAVWFGLQWLKSPAPTQRQAGPKTWITIDSDRFSADLDSAPVAISFVLDRKQKLSDHLYLASNDGEVSLVDITSIGLSNPREILRIPEEGGIKAIAANSDGSAIATLHTDKVIIWGVTERRPLRRLDQLTGAATIAFSPDKTQIAIGLASGTVQIRDIVSGDEVKRLPLRADDAIRWSLDGKTIAASARLFGGEAVRIHNLESNTEVSLIEAKSPPESFELIPGGRALGVLRDQLHEWDLNDGNKTTQFGQEVISAAYSSSGAFGITLDRHGRLDLWDIGPRSHVKSIARLPEGKSKLAIVESGNMALVLRDKSLRVYVLPELKQTFVDRRAALYEPATRMMAAGLGKRLFLVGNRRVTRTSVPLPQGVQFNPIEVASASPASAVAPFTSPNLNDPQGLLAAKIVSAGGKGIIQFFTDINSNGGPDRTYEGHLGTVSEIITLGSGQQFISAGADGTIRIWETASQKQLQSMDVGFPITCMAKAPDDIHVAVGGAGGKLELWNLQSHQRERSFSAHVREISDLAAATNVPMFASASGENQIYLWDLQSAGPIGALDSPSPTFSIAITPDGQQIAGGGADGVVRLWRAGFKVAEYALRLHTGRVHSIVMNATGRSGFSTGADSYLVAWDIPNGP